MKKVLATALFGRDEEYEQYLRAWLRGALNLFPAQDDWTIFLAVDDMTADRYARFFERLRTAGLVEVRSFGSAPLCQAMLWRMAPVFEPTDVVFCRDIDAPPMPRDRACCDAFIDSDCVAHTVHDSPLHVGIMGGLCGFRSHAFREATGIVKLDGLFAAANLTDEMWANHGADQVALNRLLDRIGGPKLLEHRFTGWAAGQPAQLARRRPGYYDCAGQSACVPDAGRPWNDGLAAEVVESADWLGNHLGCDGYDQAKAIAFWDQHGDQHVALWLRACEGDGI